MQSEFSPYDTVAYPSYSYPDTHPNRMAAMAMLHGLRPAPVEHCRVLEIGCSEGGNLIPMAYALPESQFVGFDLAGVPIERGQERIRALGLTNIRLFEGDLMDAGAELGKFDYIIAHGLYAWVPEPVRDRLMALCGELLNADGVAFVSYDALPGGHIRLMTREIMLLGTDRLADPEAWIPQARGLLQAVCDARPDDDMYRPLLKKQIDWMEKRRAQTIFHDELSEEYHPVWFTDFAKHAQRHGLQYLSESTLPPPDDRASQPGFRRTLEDAGGDVVKQEQLKDFARMRVFRETLVCRAERTVKREFAAEDLRRLCVTSQAASSPGSTEGARVFMLPSGVKLETNHSGVITLLSTLEARWPHATILNDLEPQLAEVGLAFDSDGMEILTQLAFARMITFHAWKAALAEGVSERPRASAVGRQEAAQQPYATTLLHAMLSLSDPIWRRLLVLLDGTRDRAELLTALKDAFPDTPDEEIERKLDRGLVVFYRSAMLEA